jgi:hypothetical protein
VLVGDVTSAAPKDPGESGTGAVAPAERRRRSATATLLQLGAIAGAIASIVGIVLLAVHGVGSLVGDKPSVNPVETLRLTIPRPSVHRMTYATWAKRNIGPEHPKAAEALAHAPGADTAGVEVDYDVSAPKVAVGTLYRVRYTLLREPGNTPVGRPIPDLKRFTHRGDVCGCASAFIKVPHTRHLYRVEITIAPAEEHDDSPAHRVISETFRGTGV